MIPKVIHYCWFGGKKLPMDVVKCIESWKKICPEYTIVRWDESNFNVYENEFDYINSLDIDYQYKKLLFAFLIQIRLNQAVIKIKEEKKSESHKKKDLEKRKKKNGEEHYYFKGGKQRYKEIKSMANVSNKIDINDDFINSLSLEENPLIQPLHTGLISLNYIKNCKREGDILFEVKDYENVGLYFDFHNHVKGIELCDYCKQPFKQQRKDSRFCNKHKEYQPIETKIIQCIDCGKDVVVDSKDTKSVRCNECEKIHRNNYQKELMRKRRNC